MSGFKARRNDARLQWDFTEFGGGKGTTPEPSDNMIFDFMQRMQEAQTGAEGQSEDNIDTASARQTHEDMLTAVVDLTQGNPGREDLMCLPFAVRNEYFTYLLEQLTNPGEGQAASSSSQKAQRSG